MRKIVQLGYPTLTQKALKVEDFKEKAFQDLVDDLLETVQNAGDHAAGLAANQIGELKSVTVLLRMDLMNNPEHDGSDIWEVVVNPEVTRKSEALSTRWEGCLSVRNGDLFGEVSRPRRVRVSYQDRYGNVKELRTDGYFSHLVQHEIDHLNGILFTSYIKDPTKLYTSKELDEFKKKQKKNGGK